MAAQVETVAALGLLQDDLRTKDDSVGAGLEDALAHARMDHAVSLLRGGRRSDALQAVWLNFLRRPGLRSAQEFLSVWRGL